MKQTNREQIVVLDVKEASPVAGGAPSPESALKKLHDQLKFLDFLRFLKTLGRK